MITPIEMQSKSFKSGGLGYDKKDVDQFMHEVLVSYESVYRENMELKDKVATLNQGIQYYKAIEKTIQKALVLAEKTAEETKQAAYKNAKHIENEAVTKSQIMVADARNELEHIHNQTIQIIQQYEKYKAQFKSLAAAQIELLESDSFAIQVARLDTFIQTDAEPSVTKIMEEDINWMESAKNITDDTINMEKELIQVQKELKEAEEELHDFNFIHLDEEN